MNSTIGAPPVAAAERVLLHRMLVKSLSNKESPLASLYAVNRSGLVICCELL